jgi:hypothetical protein
MSATLETYIQSLQQNPLDAALNHVHLGIIADLDRNRISNQTKWSPTMLRPRSNIGFETLRHEPLTYKEQVIPRIGILDHRVIDGVVYDPFTLQRKSKGFSLPPMKLSYGSTHKYETHQFVDRPTYSFKEQQALKKFHEKALEDQIKDLEKVIKTQRVRDESVQTDFLPEHSSVARPLTRHVVTSSPVGVNVSTSTDFTPNAASPGLSPIQTEPDISYSDLSSPPRRSPTVTPSQSVPDLMAESVSSSSSRRPVSSPTNPFEAEGRIEDIVRPAVRPGEPFIPTEYTMEEFVSTVKSHTNRELEGFIKLKPVGHRRTPIRSTMSPRKSGSRKRMVKEDLVNIITNRLVEEYHGNTTDAYNEFVSKI